MGEFCPSMTTSLALSDFDFALPRELIAQHPAAERSAARLLDARAEAPRDRHVRDLPDLLRPGDLLVVNDTAVIKARLFGVKASGGAVEALVERVEADDVVLAQLRASKSPKAGSVVRFADGDDLPGTRHPARASVLHFGCSPSVPSVQSTTFRSARTAPAPNDVTEKKRSRSPRRANRCFRGEPG